MREKKHVAPHATILQVHTGLMDVDDIDTIFTMSKMVPPTSVVLLFVVNYCIMVSVRTGRDSLYWSLNQPMNCRHVLLSFLTNHIEVVRKESVPSYRSPIGRTRDRPKDTNMNT